MRLNRRVLAAVAFFAIPAIALVTRQADAWPTNSPSARAAARLKYYPPRNWIRHYLGDDRYKIAGGVWNVVSTQTDTYYHRATCPNMLRQSADIVIGFNKSSEADEAGYRADPVCQPGATAFIYIAPRGQSVARGPVVPLTNSGSKTRTIVLSDGKSTVGLPPGWTHISSQKDDVLDGFFNEDKLKPPSGKGNVTIMSMAFSKSDPKLIKLTEIVENHWDIHQITRFQPNESINSILSKYKDLADIVSIRHFRLGGLPGIHLRQANGRPRKNGLAQSWFVGRGRVLYGIDDFTGGANGVNTIVSTYRPR